MAPLPDPETPLFRKTAIDQHLAGAPAGTVLDISPPWTWAGLATVAFLFLLAAAGSFVYETEVVGRARAIIRPTAGIRSLTSQLDGVVRVVFVQSGQSVAKSSPIMRLDASQSQAQLLDSERHVRLLESQNDVYTRNQVDSLYEQQGILEKRGLTLADQLDSHTQSVAAAERKVRISHELLRSGLISELAVEDAREAFAQAKRQWNSVRLQADENRQELLMLAARRQDVVWQSLKELESARSRRDALAYSLELTTIRAPEQGLVEAILAKEGDRVAAGQIIGKLIPEGDNLVATAFLPERDRSFLGVGDTVRIELDQLPYLEFGTLEGRITRIANELASPGEIQNIAGNDIRLDGPTYRMDVALSAPSVSRLPVPLRSGMLADLRYTLRRQRLITLVLSPLRRWLD